MLKDEEFEIYKRFYEKCKARPKNTFGHVITKYLFAIFKEAEAELEELNKLTVHGDND